MEKLELKKEDLKKLDELLMDLKDFALIHGLPMFYSIAVADDGESTEYLNDIVSPRTLGKELSDNRIRYHELVATGFVAVPKREACEIQADEVFAPLEEE